jgi:hypothetical protein
MEIHDPPTPDRYVPFGTRTAFSHAPFGAVGHKMTNDTKRSQFYDPGCSATLACACRER